MLFERVVIGAGLAGLLAAQRALERGEKVLVLERSNYSGGSVARTEIAGLAIDSGAESFSIASKHLERLITELGLEQELTEPRSLSPWIISNAERYKIPKGFFGIPASLEDQELIEIVGLEAIDRARVLDSAQVGDYDTVADLVLSRLGSEFLERIIRPVISGVHGSDPENLSVRSLMPQLIRALEKTGSVIEAASTLRLAAKRPGVAVKSLRGGMFQVIDALVQRLANSGVEILPGNNVLSIQKTATSWLIRTPDTELSTAKLTLASGAKLLDQITHQSQLIQQPRPETKLTTVGIVLAHVRSKELGRFPLGTGALSRTDSSWQAKATTHISAKWEWVEELLPKDEHLLRFSYGKNGILPENISELAANELATIYQITDAEVLEMKEIFWPETLIRSTTQNLELIDKFPGLEICGAAISGNGLLGIVRDHYERNEV
jgi:protoporphyrinogen/coproporphyrinogen III oxidase